MPVYFPSRKLSTDNAAMIAAAAFPKLWAEDFAGADFSAEASLALPKDLGHCACGEEVFQRLLQLLFNIQVFVDNGVGSLFLYVSG